MVRISKPSANPVRSLEGVATTSATDGPNATNIDTTQIDGDVDDSFSLGSQPTQMPIDRERIGHASSTPEITDRALAATISSERARMGRGAGVHDAGKGLNANASHLRSASGPIAKGDWDHPERIVGKLTQHPAKGALDAQNANDRCGPSNLLGGALMAGPERAQAFLDAAANNDRLSASEQKELHAIAAHVGNKTATFDELSRAQGLLYKAGNTRGDFAEALSDAEKSPKLTKAEKARVHKFYDDVVNNNGGLTMAQKDELSKLLTKAHGSNVTVQLEDDPQHPGDASKQYWGVSIDNDHSGFDDDEIEKLAQSGGASTKHIDVDFKADHPLDDALAKLGPGESMTVRVSGDDDDNAADHFITVGKKSDGTPYVYNPDPAKGDYTLHTGPGSSFLDEVHKYEGRMAVDSDGDQPIAVARSW